jgi:hypothetical protein
MSLTQRLLIFAEPLRVFADDPDKLPDKVVKAFVELGNLQRDKPEHAMLRVQRIMGGGVLSPLVEHVGDLTHRMTEHVGYNAVYGWEDKILRPLRWLKHGYGFAREYKENVKNNAREQGIAPDFLQAKLDLALIKYADAHAELPVYNRAQYLARQAAIDIGKQNFAGSQKCLQELADLGSEDAWVKAAMEYKLDQHGDPIRYMPDNKSLAHALQMFAYIGELYHFTNTPDAVKILQTGQIKLTTNVGTLSDQGATPYYFSMTRSKIGAYHKDNPQGTVLVIDPDYLTKYGKIGPIDYWGREFRKVQPTGNEMEERLWSNQQFIALPKPPTKLIKSLHVLVNTKDSWGGKFKFNARRLWLAAKQQHIPFFFYNDRNAWRLQDTRKAIPLKQAKSQLTGPEILPSGWARSKHFKVYLELYHAKSYDKLSKRAKEIWRQSLPGSFYNSDAINSLQSTVHNMKTDPEVSKLVNIISKHGGVKSFIAYLGNKFPEQRQ